jgi:phage-related minor tail protein
MPTIPKLYTFTNTSVQVLNAIRNSATQNYQNYVPKATANADSIREIGAIIMDNVALQNEFTNALVNRIGKVIVTSKSYQNSLRMFKKGMLEFGETIEEVFVELI